jgi:CubicO group peptidase (beta-lactamase class C family)
MPIDRSFDLTNWMTAPYNRSAFQRVRELVPTARIAAALEPSPLLRDERPLDDVAVRSRDGRSISWREHLETSWCDAVCVVHDGRIVDERYFGDMHEQRLHLLMSVSKSVCGAALGNAVGAGKLQMHDLVTDLAPEFAGTSLEGATVRHLVDMTAGTDFLEDYDSYLEADTSAGGEIPLIEYERQAGYRPLGSRSPIGTLGHFRTYGTAFAHGDRFQYRSPLTNVVARILEVIDDMPYPDIVSRDVWAPIGAEHDADIILDPLRHPVVEGGMSCTLRDLARLGLAYLDDGRIGDTQAIPEAWVLDTRHGDDECMRAFEQQVGGNHESWAMYRNAFWVLQRDAVFSGLGIFGQYCWIHRPSRTVVARFSTYPEALPVDLSAETLGAFETIAEHLAATA